MYNRCGTSRHCTLRLSSWGRTSRGLWSCCERFGGRGAFLLSKHYCNLDLISALRPLSRLGRMIGIRSPRLGGILGEKSPRRPSLFFGLSGSRTRPPEEMRLREEQEDTGGGRAGSSVSPVLRSNCSPSRGSFPELSWGWGRISNNWVRAGRVWRFRPSRLLV